MKWGADRSTRIEIHVCCNNALCLEYGKSISIIGEEQDLCPVILQRTFNLVQCLTSIPHDISDLFMNTFEKIPKTITNFSKEVQQF